LNLMTRPQWRTVTGGSRAYVAKLTASFADHVRKACAVAQVRRLAGGGVEVRDVHGRVERFDRVVIATHADQALTLLEAPTAQERAILGAFRYSSNLAVLHDDPALMPRRRAAWSGWNHIGRRDQPDGFCVTYWMNLLQTLPRDRNLFVTLNPRRPPDPAKVIGSYIYDHPLFDTAALQAQTRLWSLQGVGGVWYCGAHFGAGFHEDGLQSGLAAAEHLSADQVAPVRRPWSVDNESGRIHITATGDPVEDMAA
jgi:predicted NAD/FAD-binding protein